MNAILQEAAQRLSLQDEVVPWHGGRFSLEQALQSHRGKLGIACSGGADSVCLLLLVWGHFCDWRERMVVLHFNHGLRGADADADAAFVAQMAAGLGLRCRQERSTRVLPEASEAALRAERMRFYEGSGCGLILQGHQADDILETLLMRVLRGSGTDGLAAPRPVHRHRSGITFIRPLLGLSRAGIRQALVDCQIAWREDASNAGQAYLRNRIRHQIVENLECISGQDIRQGGLRSRALLEEDATALDALSREYLKRACHGEGLALQRGTLPALLRRMIQHWLPLQGLKPLTPGNMERLLDAWKSDERAHFSHDATLLVYENGILRCVEEKAAPAWPETPLLPVGCVYTPGGYCLSARVQALSDVARERICSGQVDPRHEAVIDAQYYQGQTLRLRCWQSGDRYHPLGAPGSRKLQDCFTDKKIPRAERSRLPLVFLKEGIVWVPGFPPADACRITPDTKTALWLTCR